MSKLCSLPRIMDFTAFDQFFPTELPLFRVRIIPVHVRLSMTVVSPCFYRRYGAC